MSKPAVRAVVIKDGQLLVIKRVKKGRKYMVIPGGRIEQGEEQTEALIREMAEETGVLIDNLRLKFVEEPNDPRWGTQYIYVADYVSGGEPELHPDSEEAAIMASGNDVYDPQWYPIDQLPDDENPFLSGRLCDEILKASRNGFADEPVKWSL